MMARETRRRGPRARRAGIVLYLLWPTVVVLTILFVAALLTLRP